MSDHDAELRIIHRQIQTLSVSYWKSISTLLKCDRMPMLRWKKKVDDLSDACKHHFFCPLDLGYLTILDIHQHFDEEGKINLRSWLKPVDDVDEEKTLQRSRQWPNTCKWILSKPLYCDWMLGVLPRILWCHARPGSGKSVLASYLAQQFEAAGDHCCFFPFRYNNESLRYPQNLLRTFSYQMAEQFPQIQKCLSALSADIAYTESARLGLLWQKLFCNGIFQIYAEDPFYWIIDALDEGEPSEVLQFLSLLSDLQISRTPIKVILFSRYNREIAMRLSALPIVVSEILPEDNSEDIALYAKERLSVSATSIDRSLQAELLDLILKKSSGTFLWVSQVIDAIEQEELVSELVTSIDNSVQGLWSFYARILNQMANMKPQQKVIAKALLGWTTCAARPLTLTELDVALKRSFGKVTDVASTVKNLCGQLLGVDKQQRVQANHMTVQEYLKSSAHENFRVDTLEWDHKIADCCFNILSPIQYESDVYDELIDEGPSPSEIDAFKEYACLFWHIHISRVPCSQARVERVNNFLDSPGGVAWLKSLAEYKKLDQIIAVIQTLKTWNAADPVLYNIQLLGNLQMLSERIGYTIDQYLGRKIDGMRHGQGTVEFANGDHFAGQWKRDVREGKGKCTFASGEVYEGLWSNDEFHGYGRLYRPDGCVYEGEWVAGRRHGFGIMQWTWTERFKYEGNWFHDRFHGDGKMIYYTGSSYDGQWAHGREHGHGKITYWNGDSYEGEFEDGCEVGDIERKGQAPQIAYQNETMGTATLHYISGARYEGMVSPAGLPDGKGTLFGTTGNLWTGEFKNGRANGPGYATRPRGGKLFGCLENFVAEGQFIDINDEPGGGTYVGMLSDIAREGHGILETAFGYTYEGEFHRNEMHGPGVRKYHNGDQYEGQSKDGCMEGFGTMLFADGWKYEGYWMKDKKNGEGTLELAGFGKLVGTWVNDQLKRDTALIMAKAGQTLADLPSRSFI